MSEDWFDIAYINHGQEAILHGSRADQTGVRQVLTLVQKEEVARLQDRQRDEMQFLLRGFAGKFEIRAAP